MQLLLFLFFIYIVLKSVVIFIKKKKCGDMGSGTLSFYWYGRLFFSVVSFYYLFYLFSSLRFQLFHQRKKKVGRTRLKETIENKINTLSLLMKIEFFFFFCFFGFIYWNFYYNIRFEAEKMWETSKTYIL